MSVVTNAAVAPAAVAHTPWMRAAVYFQAISQGFTHSQKSSNVDVFTKGTKAVEVSWTSTVMGEGNLFSGGKLTKSIPAGKQGKLQLVTNALGHRAMTVSQKWSASDLFTLQDGKKVKASREELKAAAVQLFKSI